MVFSCTKVRYGAQLRCEYDGAVYSQYLSNLTAHKVSSASVTIVSFARPLYSLPTTQTLSNLTMGTLFLPEVLSTFISLLISLLPFLLN